MAEWLGSSLQNCVYRFDSGLGLVRPKRVYYELPTKKKQTYKKFGWRGMSNFMLLGIFFGAPESYVAWVWSRYQHDWFIFWLISSAYVLLFAIYMLIARPWQKQ